MISCCLSIDPAVLLVPSYSFISDGRSRKTVLDWVNQHLSDRQVLLCIQPMFSLEYLQANPGHSGLSLTWPEMRGHILDYRGAATVMILGNTPGETAVSIKSGISSICVSQLCLVDECVFNIDDTQQIRFDAVYNARLNLAKRHHLATGISSLALIYGNNWQGDPDLYSYPAEARRLLPHASFLNGVLSGDEHDTHHFFSADEVRTILNQSRVGLALSEVEGAMYASVEYLLCGLPVVSPPSLGGRDILYTPENSIICADNPVAVAEAVMRLREEQWPRNNVRNVTLALMADHRQRLVDLVAQFVPGFAMPQLLKVIRTSYHGHNFWNPDMLQAHLHAA